MFTHIGIIAKSGNPRVTATLGELVTLLNSLSCAITLDQDSAQAAPDLNIPLADRDTIGRQCDLVIIVAGDGTFLSAARSLVQYDVALLGVNQGRLGFLADLMPDRMDEHLRDILAGQFREERRFLLRASVVRDGETVQVLHALNELVANKSNIGRLIEFKTLIDSRLVNSQRSDGLIVATPTGSTAYALSGGGPILDATLDAIVLVPICPHTLSSRPLVVASDAVIEIEMLGDAQGSAQLSADGQATLALAPGDCIQIRKHDQTIRLIHPEHYDFYATLRTKLRWGLEP